VATNPDPGHISDALWWFWEQLHAMEPDTQLGGFYASKPGYHNTRANLLAKPEWRNDYSIQLSADKRGPADKSAALDWTFPEAHGGDYRRIAKYGARVRAAFSERDPQLTGWREVLGQSDTDLAPEGYDFVTWTTRQPDNTHRWHMHFSVLREFITSLPHMRNMLLVLGWEDDVSDVSYKIQSTTDRNGEVWVSNRIHRRKLRSPGGIQTPARAGTTQVVLTDAMRLSVSATTDWDTYLDAVAGNEFPTLTCTCDCNCGTAHSHTIGPAVPAEE